ncbi:MAG TPA: hypothetical protein VMU83_15330 [Hanamia sp.]|nr:hypothetical protein [Hanamia sp.]
MAGETIKGKIRELADALATRRTALLAMMVISIFNIMDVLEYVDFSSISLPPSGYDEAVILVATIASFLILAWSWKRRSLASLRKVNKVLIVLFVIMLMAEILALMIEWGTVQIGDEPYMMAFVLLGLVNSLWSKIKN